MLLCGSVTLPQPPQSWTVSKPKPNTQAQASATTLTLFTSVSFWENPEDGAWGVADNRPEHMKILNEIATLSTLRLVNWWQAKLAKGNTFLANRCRTTPFLETVTQVERER